MKDKLNVIFISGPYRDPRGEYLVRENIRYAEHEALFVWFSGGVALCPHLNTAMFGGAFGIPDDTWLKGDLELLSRCDAIYMIHGWERSTGAKAEKDYAAELGIPVLLSQDDVLAYLGVGKDRSEDDRYYRTLAD